MFEQDFLCTYAWTTNLTNGDVTTGMTWLHAMNTAAEEADITLQLCMMCPVHVLASTELSRVTNGRGTSDNSHSGSADLYPLGHSGLIMGSVGLWSSRDNVWTSPQEFGCVGSNVNCSSPDYVLQNVAAILGGGPYGPSDGIDYLNPTVIMSSCRSDGVLLRADWPLLTLDAAFRTAFDTHGSPHVWGTHTTVSGLRWGMVLGVSTTMDIPVPFSDLGLTPNLDYVVVDMWSTKNGTAAPTVKGVSRKVGNFVVPTSPPPTDNSDVGSYQLLAPITTTGWCVLGDVSKVVPTSRRRFSDMIGSGTLAAGELTATLRGASGEAFTVWYLTPSATTSLLAGMTGLTPTPVQCQASYCSGVDCDSEVVLRCQLGACHCSSAL